MSKEQMDVQKLIDHQECFQNNIKLGFKKDETRGKTILYKLSNRMVEVLEKATELCSENIKFYASICQH